MEIVATISNEKIVSYSETGEIVTISREPTDKFNFIKVSVDDLQPILSGAESLANYRVEYDFLEKKHTLKSIRKINDEKLLSSFMYELPMSRSDRADISLVRDKANYHWQLHVHEDFKKELNDNNITLDPTIGFYSVTKKHDPNVLYRLLRFDNSLKIPFEYEFEVDDIDVSVYTVRKFDSYIYEVTDG